MMPSFSPILTYLSTTKGAILVSAVITAAVAFLKPIWTWLWTEIPTSVKWLLLGMFAGSLLMWSGCGVGWHPLKRFREDKQQQAQPSNDQGRRRLLDPIE